jgi:hypothetical protein
MPTEQGRLNAIQKQPRIVKPRTARADKAKRPRPACHGPGSFRVCGTRCGELNGGTIHRWTGRGPPRDGVSLAAKGLDAKSPNRVTSHRRHVDASSRTPKMALNARSDHRVEWMVDSAPGSGGRFRPARRGARLPSRPGSRSRTPPARACRGCTAHMPKAWLGINGEMLRIFLQTRTDPPTEESAGSVRTMARFTVYLTTAAKGPNSGYSA